MREDKPDSANSLVYCSPIIITHTPLTYTYIIMIAHQSKYRKELPQLKNRNPYNCELARCIFNIPDIFSEFWCLFNPLFYACQKLMWTEKYDLSTD